MRLENRGKIGSGPGLFFLKKIVFLTILFIVAALPGIGCSMTSSETNRGPMVGGPCEYRSYPGSAEILSVVPAAADGGVERFDVRFRFAPDGPVEESLGRAALERTHPLLPDRQQPPDRFYVEKHDIRPGKVIACTLRVIRRGTCTPILFDFPPGEAAPR